MLFSLLLLLEVLWSQPQYLLMSNTLSTWLVQHTLFWYVAYPIKSSVNSCQHRQDRNLVTPHSSGSQLSGGIKSPQNPGRVKPRTARAVKMHLEVQVHTLTYRRGCKVLTQALVVLIFFSITNLVTSFPGIRILEEEIKRSKLKM